VAANRTTATTADNSSNSSNGAHRWVSVDIEGAHFKPGALVKLTRPGVHEVEPERWQVLDATHIRAVFDLRNVPLGLYDLSVINPDGQRVTEAQRFLVERAIEADVTIGIGGPRTLTPGENGLYSVSLQSLSNVDTPYVRFDLGVPEMGYSDEVLNGIALPYLVVGSNVGGRPDGVSLDAAGNTQTYGPTPTSGTSRPDIPWASLDGALNTDGINLLPGYALDVAAGGYVGMSFNVQTYPGLAEWLAYDFDGLRDKLYALRPEWKEQGLLDGGVQDLERIAEGLAQKFLARNPDEHLLKIEQLAMPFRFDISGAATPLTRDEFVAEQVAHATRLRAAILADAAAPASLAALAADPTQWIAGWLGALEAAGLLRPLDEAPPIRSHPKVVSLNSTLASGILLAHGGDAYRTQGDLLGFFATVQKWYGDTAAFAGDPEATAAPVDYDEYRQSLAGFVEIPVPVTAERADYDRQASQATHFINFNVFAGGLGELEYLRHIGVLDADFKPLPGQALDLTRYLQQAASESAANAALLSVRGPQAALGSDGNSYVPGATPLPYALDFSTPDGAPAGQLRLLTQLDASLDARSFRLGDLKLGDINVHLPAGKASFQGDFDFSGSKGFVLRVSAGIDVATRTATWLLQAIDPQSGEVLHDALRGLLAAAAGEPSDGSAPQRASLSYTVSASDSAASGVDIVSVARLFIDQAPPIDSERNLVRLDAEAPRTTLAVTALGASAHDAPIFDVRWRADDTALAAGSGDNGDDSGGTASAGAASGVKSVTVYVAEDGGEFRIWQRQVEPTIGQAIFTGSAGKRYEFLAVATDRAGNREAASVARAVLPDDGARQEILDAIGVNESLAQTAELPLAAIDRSYPSNALFAEAERLLPGHVTSSQSSDLRSVLAPFSLRSFAAGYAASDADIGAQALVELADHSFLASAGAERNQVFHLAGNGGPATATDAVNTSASRLMPLFTLDAPILDMAIDRFGQLWLTTGAELLQLDAASGQIIERQRGPGGDPLTHALAIDPSSGKIYISSGNGIEIFDPNASDRSRAWQHFSNQRVGDLAFSADGRLWGVKWSGGEIAGAQLQASSEIVSFPLDGRSAGRAELEYRLAGVVDRIAFGAVGSALDGLLFASSNLRQRAVGAGTTSTPQQSPLWMIELDSRRALQVAAGGSRGESVVATADGRLLVAQTTGIDEISRHRAPLVQAITVPDGALVPLPLTHIGVVFDQAMWLGTVADGSVAADTRSVLDPANYTLTPLSALGAEPGAESVQLQPQAVRWDAQSRSAWLEVSGLSAGEYQIDIAASLQSAAETPLQNAYASRFTAVTDMSSRLQLNFSNTRANRASGEISYEVSVTNVGSDDIRGPLLLLLDAGHYFADAIAGAQPAGAALAAPAEPAASFQHSELWTIDLSAALQTLGGRLAVGATIAGQTVRVTPGSELAPRAGLVELLKTNLGHGVYAFPQDNLPPSLVVADWLDSEQLPPARVGEEWSATLEALDADGTRFWWQLVEAPPGVTLTATAEITSSAQAAQATATLAWTPAASADASSKIVVRVEDSRGGVALREFSLPVIGGNRAPVIEGAYDLSIAEGETLSLPLLAADADGDRLSLALRNLPYGATFDATSGVLSWTPDYDQAGVWEAVTVIASDGKRTSSSPFTITVEQAYAPPVLATVAAQSLREGEAWALQLAASVPGMIAGRAQADGTTLSLEYGALWLPGGATLDAQSGWFAWTPGFDQQGPYRVPLSIVATWTTLAGETSYSVLSRELVLNVANANGAPIFEAPETWRVLEGQPLRISVFAFDPDNPAFEPRIRRHPGGEAIGPESSAPTLSYQLSGLPAGASFDAETMEILWTPDYTQAGSYSVVVTATDDGDGTGTPASSQMTLPIVVSNANRAPQIGDLGNAFVDAGGVLEIPFSVGDVDGNPVAIEISGLPRFATYAQLPPAATGPEADPASAPLRGAIRFAPGAGDRGDYTLTITASDDGDGDATQRLSETRSFVLSVRSLSEAPLIAAPRQVVALVGQPLSVAIIASDLDQDPLSWTSTGLPLGAELIPASQYGQARLRWTPTADDLGSRDVELILTDSGLPPQDGSFSNPEHPLPNVSRHTLRIIVRSENAAPELLAVLANGQPLVDDSSAAGEPAALRIDAREGQPLALEVFAQDSDSDALHWRVAGLPRGMRFSADGNRAAFDWTPDLFAAQDAGDPDPSALQAGHWRFSVTASDGMATFSRDFEIIVANANQAPRILPTPLQLINEGETLAFTVVATDADRDAVQLSLVYDEETPTGVSFNAGNGRFEWTPEDVVDNSSGDSRSYTLTFRANDGRGADNSINTQSVQIRVFDVNRRPQISASNHAVVIGDTLSIPVVFGGGGGASTGIALGDADGASQTAALAISFSGLPEGARYDADSRHLVWTPGAGQIGDFTVSATVRDGQARNGTASTVFTLRVVAEAAANAPTILVSTTPSTPALPGQTILASVRADAWSGIAQLAVAVRGAALGPLMGPAKRRGKWSGKRS
jgi:hypothetical protein